MYVEDKSSGLEGEARIGRVTFSKTGKTLNYRGRSFQSLKGAGFKSNYYDVETGEEFWISGPRKDGNDRLYGGQEGVIIDDDVAEEYWCGIRGNEDITEVTKGKQTPRTFGRPLDTAPPSAAHHIGPTRPLLRRVPKEV